MKYHKILLIFFIGLVVFSCVEDEEFIKPVELSIATDSKLFSLALDDEFRLNTTVPNFSDNFASIQWNSDAPNIVSVDNSGKLTPKSKGNTEISLVSSKNEDILSEDRFILEVGNFTFLRSEVEKRALNENNLKELAELGFPAFIEFTKFIITINIEDKSQKNEAQFFNILNRLQKVDFIWSSDNESVITVDNEGKLNPIAEGEALISVSVDENLGNKDSDILTLSRTIIVNSSETVIEEIEEPELGNDIIADGSFMSLDYVTNGTFTIEVVEGKTFLNIKDDFFVEFSLPDLVVYLSNVTDSQSGANLIAENLPSSGAMRFEIPTNVNPKDYKNVLFYCREFNLPVGFGEIKFK